MFKLYFNLNLIIFLILLSDEVKEKAQRILKTSDLLIQEYMPRISEGEVSFLFYGGRFSHAVEKKPAHNEHRIHKAYGGQHQRYIPTNNEIQQVKKIIEAVQEETNTEIETIETFAKLILFTYKKTCIPIKIKTKLNVKLFKTI